MQKFYQKMTYKNNLKYIVEKEDHVDIIVKGENDEEAKTSKDKESMADA